MKLLGHEIKITEENPGMWSGDGMGRSSIGDCSIAIKQGMPLDVKHSTLIHEIVHMIADHNGAKLDEQAVSTMAIGFFTWIKDNPEMAVSIAHRQEVK